MFAPPTVAAMADFEAVRRDIGRRVAELRAARGLTQEELAAELGVQPPYLRKVERGAQALSLRQMVRFADALGAPVRALFDPPTSQARPGRPPRQKTSRQPPTD